MLLSALPVDAGQTIAGRIEALDAFMSRLRSLADAHDLPARNHWMQAPVPDVVTGALRTFGERFLLNGPDISLPVQASLALVLSLHELATNAVKYGAMSNEVGRVDISWQLIGHHHARLVWTETGARELKSSSRVRLGFSAAES